MRSSRVFVFFCIVFFIGATSGQYEGGGLYINENAGAIITDCTFDGNTADSGAGIYAKKAGEVKITNTKIINNQATSSNTDYGRGGGLYVESGLNMTIVHSYIDFNNATQYGGGLFILEAPVSVANTSVSRNSVTQGFGNIFGGGIYIKDEASASTVTFDSVSVTQNTNTNGYGGGFYISSIGRVVVKNSVVSSNKAYNGAGINAQNGEFDNVQIINNEATNIAGGLYANSFAPFFIDVKNSNITGNIAAFSTGIEVYEADSSSFIMKNTLLTTYNSMSVTRYCTAIGQLTFVTNLLSSFPSCLHCTTRSGSGGCECGVEVTHTTGCTACAQWWSLPNNMCYQSVDSCTVNHGGCDSLANCTDGVGQNPTCGDCPFGYTGTGYVQCTDIKECDTNNGNCDSFTKCIEKNGSLPECGPCPEGYHGSGYTNCTRDNLCLINNGGCAANSTCVYNTRANHTCGACHAGFSGSGNTTCTPVCTSACAHGTCAAPDVCDCGLTGYTGPQCQTPVCTSPCMNGGICSAPEYCNCTGTGYNGTLCDSVKCDNIVCEHGGICASPDVCDCSQTGYNGTTCSQDIDECKINGTALCPGANANCTNTPGHYVCGCVSGYAVNGTSGICELIPVVIPTDAPTPAPTPATDAPTPAPTPATSAPTPASTEAPTPAPTPATAAPTPASTEAPTPAPTPATEAPTPAPTPATEAPTPAPNTTANPAITTAPPTTVPPTTTRPPTVLPTTIPHPVFTCGDGNCTIAADEDCVTCPLDCGGTNKSCGKCGDGFCDSGETCTSCLRDCGRCVDPQVPVPKCPKDCSGHGQCSRGTCICSDGWLGVDCATALVPVPIVVQPNKTAPVIVINVPGFGVTGGAGSGSGSTTQGTTGSGQSSTTSPGNNPTPITFSVSLTEVREITGEVNVPPVQKISLENAQYTYQPLEGPTFTASQYTTVLENGALLNVFVYSYNSTTQINFAEQALTLKADELKVTFSVSNWPFFSLRNTFQLIMGASTSGADENTQKCNDVQTQIDGNGVLRSYKFNVGELSLYGQFLKDALVDGRARQLAITEESKTQDKVLIALSSPVFLDELIIDPNYAVLLNPEGTTDGCLSNQLAPPSSNTVSNTVIIAVVCAVGGVAIIAAAAGIVISRRRKQKFWRRSNSARKL